MKQQTAVVAAMMMGALLALTGCTAHELEATPTGSTKPVVTETETPAPDVTPTQEPAAPGPDEGAPGEQYTMSDGTKVAVDPHAPLPAEVVSEIKSNAGDLSQPPSFENRQADVERMAAAVEEGESTGKIIVAVFASGLYDPKTETLVESFYNLYSSDREFNGRKLGSADEAIAVAQGIIATRAEPSLYEVIDLTR